MRTPIARCVAALLLLSACASRQGAPPAAATAAAPATDDAAILDVVKRVARHQLRPLADGDYPTIDGEEVLKVAEDRKSVV